MTRGWKRHCLPCLATLRPDGFAGYAPIDPTGKGTLTTGLLTLQGDGLRVSADAAGGALRVSLLDPAGQTLATSLPVSADVTDALLSWPDANPLPALQGRALRLLATLDRATLYALGGVELLPQSAAPLPPPRPLPRAAATGVEHHAAFGRDADGWRETIHHVGKVVVIPVTGDRPSSFDLGAFAMRTASD